jgi:hypothetical protein
MRATRQFRGLGQSLLVDNINRDPLSPVTVNHCTDELSMIYPATAIRTGCQEK